jgi:prepilin-type N-terminal cleavage/methylation domain-containing protein
MAHGSHTAALGRREHGFTLIELLVVLVVIAALLAIAVPVYGSIRSQGQDAVAKSALHEGKVAAEAYFVDNDTYKKMTINKLRKTYDSSLTTSSAFKLTKKTATTYCFKYVSDSGTTYWLKGPGGSSATAKPSGC